MASSVWRRQPSTRLRSENLLRHRPAAQVADDFFEIVVLVTTNALHVREVDIDLMVRER